MKSLPSSLLFAFRKCLITTRLSLVTMSVVYVLGTESVAKAQANPLKVELSVICTRDKQHVVEFELKNNENFEIEFSDGKLPWRHAYSMTLLVVSAGEDGDQLGRSGPVQDLNGVKVKLAPNKSIKGKIILSELYPEIDKAISKTGVDIFWSYQLKTIDKKQSKRMGGWIEIPKSTK